jgi:hypothetical protein
MGRNRRSGDSIMIVTTRLFSALMFIFFTASATVEASYLEPSGSASLPAPAPNASSEPHHHATSGSGSGHPSGTGSHATNNSTNHAVGAKSAASSATHASGTSGYHVTNYSTNHATGAKSNSSSAGHSSTASGYHVTNYSTNHLTGMKGDSSSPEHATGTGSHTPTKFHPATTTYHSASTNYHAAPASGHSTAVKSSVSSTNHRSELLAPGVTRGIARGKISNPRFYGGITALHDAHSTLRLVRQYALHPALYRGYWAGGWYHGYWHQYWAYQPWAWYNNHYGFWLANNSANVFVVETTPGVCSYWNGFAWVSWWNPPYTPYYCPY